MKVFKVFFNNMINALKWRYILWKILSKDN